MNHLIEFKLTICTGGENEQVEITIAGSNGTIGMDRMTVEDLKDGGTSIIVPLDSESINFLIASLKSVQERMQP